MAALQSTEPILKSTESYSSARKLQELFLQRNFISSELDVIFNNEVGRNNETEAKVPINNLPRASREDITFKMQTLQELDIQITKLQEHLAKHSAGEKPNHLCHPNMPEFLNLASNFSQSNSSSFQSHGQSSVLRVFEPHLTWTSGPRIDSSLESASIISFNSTMETGGGEQLKDSGEPNLAYEQVFSILSMLNQQENDRYETARTLYDLSEVPEQARIMRQSGTLSTLIQLFHPQDVFEMDTLSEDEKVFPLVCHTVRNIVNSQSDPRRKKLELRLLDQIEYIRAYNVYIRKVLANQNEFDSVLLAIEIKPRLYHLMKASFDEDQRHITCQLGGLQAVAELLICDQILNEKLFDNNLPVDSVEVRRLTGMALTNLTFGDSTNKAALCSMARFLTTVNCQLMLPIEELRQLFASVLRNLSWKLLDANSKLALQDANVVTHLMHAAMCDNQSEKTLKAILAALWNLSAHSSNNKQIICAMEKALQFLVSTLTYVSETSSLAVVENGSGILRNISSHIAIKEEYRQVLREYNCLRILIDHLQSSSLTVVSNACGTLWNLSARNTRDQQTLLALDAPSKLRNLIHSKHRMIQMGSAAALKNLWAAQVGMCGGNGAFAAPVQPALLSARKHKAFEEEVKVERIANELCDDPPMNNSVENVQTKVGHYDHQAQQPFQHQRQATSPMEQILGLMGDTISFNNQQHLRPAEQISYPVQKSQSLSSASVSSKEDRILNDKALTQRYHNSLRRRHQHHQHLLLPPPSTDDSSSISQQQQQQQFNIDSQMMPPPRPGGVCNMTPAKQSINDPFCTNATILPSGSKVGLISTDNNINFDDNDSQYSCERPKVFADDKQSEPSRWSSLSSIKHDLVFEQEAAKPQSDVKLSAGRVMNPASLVQQPGFMMHQPPVVPQHLPLPQRVHEIASQQRQQSAPPLSSYSNASTVVPMPAHVPTDYDAHNLGTSVRVTPNVMSRRSSLSSIASDDEDDRSVVDSIYSQQVTGQVSPSDLPDSPGRTMPPSPATRRRHAQPNQVIVQESKPDCMRIHDNDMEDEECPRNYASEDSNSFARRNATSEKPQLKRVVPSMVQVDESRALPPSREDVNLSRGDTVPPSPMNFADSPAVPSDEGGTSTDQDLGQVINQSLPQQSHRLSRRGRGGGAINSRFQFAAGSPVVKNDIPHQNTLFKCEDESNQNRPAPSAMFLPQRQGKAVGVTRPIPRSTEVHNEPSHEPETAISAPEVGDDDDDVIEELLYVTESENRNGRPKFELVTANSCDRNVVASHVQASDNMRRSSLDEVADGSVAAQVTVQPVVSKSVEFGNRLDEGESHCSLLDDDLDQCIYEVLPKRYHKRTSDLERRSRPSTKSGTNSHTDDSSNNTSSKTSPRTENAPAKYTAPLLPPPVPGSPAQRQRRLFDGVSNGQMSSPQQPNSCPTKASPRRATTGNTNNNSPRHQLPAACLDQKGIMECSDMSLVASYEMGLSVGSHCSTGIATASSNPTSARMTNQFSLSNFLDDVRPPDDLMLVSGSSAIVHSSMTSECVRDAAGLVSVVQSPPLKRSTKATFTIVSTDNFKPQTECMPPPVQVASNCSDVTNESLSEDNYSRIDDDSFDIAPEDIDLSLINCVDQNLDLITEEASAEELIIDCETFSFLSISSSDTTSIATEENVANTTLKNVRSRIVKPSTESNVFNNAAGAEIVCPENKVIRTALTNPVMTTAPRVNVRTTKTTELRAKRLSGKTDSSMSNNSSLASVSPNLSARNGSVSPRTTTKISPSSLGVKTTANSISNCTINSVSPSRKSKADSKESINCSSDMIKRSNKETSSESIGSGHSPNSRQSLAKSKISKKTFGYPRPAVPPKPGGGGNCVISLNNNKIGFTGSSNSVETIQKNDEHLDEIEDLSGDRPKIKSPKSVAVTVKKHLGRNVSSKIAELWKPGSTSKSEKTKGNTAKESEREPNSSAKVKHKNVSITAV